MSHTRTAVVTGGSGGIGYHVCRSLAGRGMSVVVHASTTERACATVDRLVGDGVDPGLLSAAGGDFRRLDEVFALAYGVRRRLGGQHLLVNAAGALAAPGVTDDRINTTMQINYVAPYALTRLLAPALNAANGRIVTLTSAGHRQADVKPGHLTDGTARPATAYARAHRALILFTTALARTSEQRVSAVAVHPGIVGTGSFTAVHGPGGLPAVDGAAHVLHAAGQADSGYREGMLR